jgi:hypothetical protein
MRRLLACFCLLSFAAMAQALPDALRQGATDWRVQGLGEMRWFGLRLYEAKLWVRGAAYVPEQPFALTLTYARSIPAVRIVNASVDELRRLGSQDEATLARWRAYMLKAFPDVAEGDSITGLYLPGQGARFWFGETLRAEIPDPVFARAFFDIWLDPRTREPGLRERLLGQRG